MRGLKDRVAVANVRPGSNSQSAHLRRASVRNVISIKVRSRQHRVFVRPRDYLLEDRVGDPVVDHDLLLPFAAPVRCINAVEHALDFLLHLLPERRLGKFHPRFDHLCIFRDRQLRVLILVIQNPALALGDYLIAKLFGGKLVSPLAERALGKLLDISFVHQRHRFPSALQSVLDRHPHQPLGSAH